MSHIDLKIPEHSYFFGFAQADGSLSANTRNRGKFQIEISKDDAGLLRSLKELFPSVYSSISFRERDTNFKKNHKSCTWVVCDWSFRKEVNKLGVPYGRKSMIIAPPKVDFCERDYIRGLIDGDGSVGMAGSERPFISVVVKSEKLKVYLLDMIEKLTGKRKKLNRNERDNVYNIMLNREKAQQFIDYLYYPGCLALERKMEKAKTALTWKRSEDMRRAYSKKNWERWEDEYIMNHPVEESCDHLDRSYSSVTTRRWRLRNNKT